MGMSIDKTIEFFNGLECHTPQAKDARDVAIQTMRKYQKIQKTYERFQKDDDYHPVMGWLDVMAVIEDGNVE